MNLVCEIVVLYCTVCQEFLSGIFVFYHRDCEDFVSGIVVFYRRPSQELVRATYTVCHLVCPGTVNG